MVQTRSKAKASLSHEERTVTEPRDEGLYPVTIESVTPVNNRIKTFKFALREQDTINVLSANPLLFSTVTDGQSSNQASGSTSTFPALKRREVSP
jgi:hypothetical protein